MIIMVSIFSRPLCRKTDVCTLLNCMIYCALWISRWGRLFFTRSKPDTSNYVVSNVNNIAVRTSSRPRGSAAAATATASKYSRTYRDHTVIGNQFVFFLSKSCVRFASGFEIHVNIILPQTYVYSSYVSPDI